MRRSLRTQTTMVMVLALCLGASACDDDAAPARGGGELAAVEPLAQALAAPPVSALPGHLVVWSASSRLQRVDLTPAQGDDTTPHTQSPVQVPGRVLLASSNGEALCLVVDTGQGIEVQRRTVAEPGVVSQRDALDATARRPPSALYSHGTGCIVGLAREIRFVDFASAERTYQVGLHALELGRPVRAFTRLGDVLWAIDDLEPPRVVHEFRVSRELPRYVASRPLGEDEVQAAAPGLEALSPQALAVLAPVRDVQRVDDHLFVLRGSEGGAELVHARLDGEGEPEIVSRVALPADAQRILGPSSSSATVP